MRVLTLATMLGALTFALPAEACSPPTFRDWSRAELKEDARRNVAEIDYIADVQVLGWARDQALVVGVIRQFKGPPRASFVLHPSFCGDLVPPVGRIARLLIRDGGGDSKVAFGTPDMLDREQTRFYEEQVDRLIGTRRLPGTYSQSEEIPPPP